MEQGNGKNIVSIEQEFAQLTRSIERKNGEADYAPKAPEHPALAGCRRAAEFVRGILTQHTAENETLALHLEQIGETIAQMCKEAANIVREQRVMPQEMADKIASELLHIGEVEAERQGRLHRGLTGANECIAGIDRKPQ